MIRTLRLLAVFSLMVMTLVRPSEAGTPSATSQEKVGVAVIELEGKLAERAKVMTPFGKGEATLRDATQAISHLANRGDIRAVLIKLRESQLTVTQVQELGKAIGAVRATGKKVHLYAYGFDTSELLLGSYCDEVIAQAGGGVSLPGLATSEMYLADTLAWLGVKADMVQVGDYKGAAEQMVNSKPSDAWSQNIDQLLDSMYTGIRSQMIRGRKLDDDKLDKAMNEAWSASADDAQKLGLVDSVIDLPSMGEHLGRKYDGEVDWNKVSLGAEHEEAETPSNPLAVLRMLTEKAEYEPKRETIAVLHIDGAIVDGDSTGPGLMGGEGSVGSLTIRRALSEIEKNDLIKGMVVRVDSPGGSAIASEVIWLGIRRVAAKKPVWVSVGGMAASGGYYIAVAGDRIYVNTNSIVGSIGVVGGKIAMDGLLKILKVNVFERTRGPRAGMNTIGPWSDEQRAYVRRKMTETYEVFTKRVSAGRKGIDLAKTAEGRLFTGDRAIEMKMADRIGGLDDCLADLSKHLELGKDNYDVMSYPAPMSLAEMIQEMLGKTGLGGAAAPRVAGGMPGTAGGGSIIMNEADAIGREVLGARGWESLRASMIGMMELRKEPVILMAPRVVIVR